MKIDRLLGITMELLSKKKITASEFAEKYEVSVRTIYRDMETIGMAGIPIRSTTGITGGFEIMPGYFLSKNYFSLQELGLMYSFFKSLGMGSENNAFNDVTQKLSALNNQLEETSQIFFKSVATEMEAQNLMAINQAIIESEVLIIQYTDGNGTQTKRNIHPSYLIWEDSSWYLEAYCMLRKNKRYFKLTRIDSIQKSGQFMEIEPTYQEEVKSTGFRTVLLFDCSVRSKVNEQFFDKWTKTENGLILKTEFYDKEYALSVVLSYGKKVKVIAPDWLQKELVNVLNDIQRKYRSD